MKNTMKNSLVGAAIAAACAMATPALAANDSNYIGAQLAIAEVPGTFDSGISFVGTFGMPLPQVNQNVAIEGEFTKAISKPEYNWFGTKLETDYYTIGGYGVVNVPLAQSLNLRLRGGLVYEHIEYTFGWGPTTATGTTSGLGFSAGAGITMELQPSMNLIAEYTNIDGDIDHFSAGVQIKF